MFSVQPARDLPYHSRTDNGPVDRTGLPTFWKTYHIYASAFEAYTGGIVENVALGQSFGACGNPAYAYAQLVQIINLDGYNCCVGTSVKCPSVKLEGQPRSGDFGCCRISKSQLIEGIILGSGSLYVFDDVLACNDVEGVSFDRRISVAVHGVTETKACTARFVIALDTYADNACQDFPIEKHGVAAHLDWRLEIQATG